MYVTDPVCGMEMQKEDTKFITVHKGLTYFFESPQCQQFFDLEPEAFEELPRERVYNDYGDRFDGSE